MKERDINCGTYNENNGINTDEKAVVVFDKDLVEKAIVNFLQETITPTLQPYADVLIQQCKDAIEKIVVQNVIERVEVEVHTENRTRIFERVQKRLKDEVNNHFSISDISKAEAVEKAKLIQEWIDGIGDIKEEDEELSTIWEGWFIEMNKDTKTTDQKRALDIMKTLSAEEAKLMLDIKQGNKIRPQRRLDSKKTYNYSQKLEEEKNQYLIKMLLRKELVSKINIINSKTLMPLLIMSLTLLSLFSLRFFSENIPNEFMILVDSPLILILIVVFLVLFIYPTLLKRRYRLTWIGEKIVSYAKKNTEKSRVNHDNNDRHQNNIKKDRK